MCFTGAYALRRAPRESGLASPLDVRRNPEGEAMNPTMMSVPGAAYATVGR